MTSHSVPQKNTAAILPAAGSGKRFGNEGNKLFALLAGKPIWYHSATRLRSVDAIGPIVMPISRVDQPRFQNEFAPLVDELQITIVVGGAERTDSVSAGLMEIETNQSEVSLVAVHDAARPLVSTLQIAEVIEKAKDVGAAILAQPVPATVKQDLRSDQKIKTIDRSDLWLAQTPQVFRLDWLTDAYKKYRGRPATDDAELVERIGHPVALVAGSAENLKITRPDDLRLAESIFKRQITNS